MNMVSSRSPSPRLARDAGIAIGPILFIVAILGILAAAIAAGSGSFTSSGANEGSKLKAGALIDIGQNLKLGFERVSATTDFASVGLTGTTATTDLFSPTGGGITPPSNSLAVDPTADVWHYMNIKNIGIGTASGSMLAVLKVPADVCDQVNVKANGVAAPTTAGDTAGVDNTALAIQTDDFSQAAQDATSNGAVWEYTGKTTGCQKIDGNYYFFQVMGVR